MPVAVQDAVSGKAEIGFTQNLDGRVLVVDDELPNRLYLRKLLESRGCTVLDAESGPAALELAKSQQPELILADVIMPGMDGFELCGRLKQDPRTAHILVIMVTAKSKIEDIETGFELGAMDYIRKPFNPRELILRVSNALALKKSNDALFLWKTRVSHELALAGSIQRSLFSDCPHFSAQFEVRIAYRSCMDVGGDALDVISLPGGKHCIYVADVSGHGVAPAMISSLLKATASEVIGRFADEGPSRICNELHTLIRQRIDNPSYYVTMFMALHDPNTRQWRCMNCGHPNPVVIHNGEVADSGLFSEGGGVPIGFPLGDEMPYRTKDEVVFANEGDTFLLLYTDGLSEARHSRTGEECGAHLEAVYRQVALDPTVSNKAAELMNILDKEKYELSEDDCTAISIHMVDPDKIVMERTVEVDIHNVSDLSKEVEHLLAERGITAETAGLVRLLIMELGANLVDHSGLMSEDSFWIQVRVDGFVCQLVFIDEGMEWDIDWALGCDSNGEHLKDRGRGLVIANHIVDRIERYRVNRENITCCTLLDTQV